MYHSKIIKKMKFSLSDNLKYKEKSGDKNKIHFDFSVAKNFFFKKPIVHGCNILAHCFNYYFKKDKYINFKLINVKFVNYLQINEKISVVYRKNSFIVNAKNNIILECFFKSESFSNFSSSRIFS